MTMTGQRPGLQAVERILDPDLGLGIARGWVAESRPGSTVRQARPHTALYRAPGDVSARLSVELAAVEDGDGMGELLTLLIRCRDGIIALSEFPEDPALPSLATMLDPRSALEVLVRAAPEPTLGWTGQADIRCEAALVHHPRTGPCVIRYDLSNPTGGVRRQVYAKVYRSAAEARASAAAHGAVGGRLLRGQGVAVRLPRLLGLDPDTRTVFIESLGPAHPPSADVLPQEAARVVRALHAATPADHVPEVTVLDELDRVRAELALVETRWPDLATRIAAHVDVAAECLEGTPEDPRVLSHGDFTPSQLLRLSPDVIGLLDLDTLRRAEPAADLGRYLAYASVRVSRQDVRAAENSRAADSGGSVASATDRLSAAVRTMTTATLDAYGAAASRGAPVDRALAHTRLQLSLIALRAARRFKEERVRHALDLLDHAPSRRAS